jgi:DNA-binding transcriptional ArsR family regulator
MEERNRTIMECVGPCLQKIKEHGELKEIFKKLSEGKEEFIEEILKEKVEDYQTKMVRYLSELVEEIKAKREMVRSLREGPQKEEMLKDLDDLEKELFCCLAEVFETYHFFRTLEDLSDQHVEQALNIPVGLVYRLLLR